MRRLCLFTGGFAAAAGLYLFLLHGAPGVLLAALAAVCALLFLLRRPILRRAAVCVLGLLAGFAWCRGYEALFLRPFADLSGETAAFSAQALATPQESSYGQSVSARLTLDGKSCMAVIYFDEADGEILPGSLLSGTAKFTTAQEKHLRGKDYDLSRGVFLTASCRETLHAEPGRASVLNSTLKTSPVILPSFTSTMSISSGRMTTSTGSFGLNPKSTQSKVISSKRTL